MNSQLRRREMSERFVFIGDCAGYTLAEGGVKGVAR
jgi:hypothetical protein